MAGCDYLIHYPHGCLEQTTSGAFPQVYLPALIKLDRRSAAREVENNVRAGIARLRGFQQPNGGFVYWPGGWATDYGLDWRDDWGTTYAGHFLLEAETRGLRGALGHEGRLAALPEGPRRSAGMRTPCAMAGSDQRGRALEAARYAQAYRLYTLALAQQPDLGAMNRLRESPTMSAGERWMLASAYKLADKPDVGERRWLRRRPARRPSCSTTANPYTFGSLLRDRAVVLQGLTLMGRDAESNALVEDISAQLSRRTLVQHAVGGVRAGVGGAGRRPKPFRSRSASTTRRARRGPPSRRNHRWRSVAAARAARRGHAAHGAQHLGPASCT